MFGKMEFQYHIIKSEDHLLLKQLPRLKINNHNFGCKWNLIFSPSWYLLYEFLLAYLLL